MKRLLLARITLLLASTLTAATATSVGASTIPWNVETLQSSGTPIGSIADAQSLLDGTIAHSVDVSALANTINFNLTGQAATGHFAGELAFPGISSADVDNFAIHATAYIDIVTPGAYTFGVNSDDGFELTVGPNAMKYATPRAARDTLATFNFNQPGAYPIDLVYFQHYGAAELEVFSTPGFYTSFAQPGSNFQLVGDAANGGLSLINLAIPEPSTGWLLFPMILGLLLRRRSTR